MIIASIASFTEVHTFTALPTALKSFILLSCPGLGLLPGFFISMYKCPKSPNGQHISGVPGFIPSFSSQTASLEYLLPFEVFP